MTSVTLLELLTLAELGVLNATTDADLAHWLAERRRVLDALRVAA